MSKRSTAAASVGGKISSSHNESTQGTKQQATGTHKLYNSTVDDDLFDDACDFGQFMMSPAWYIFVKVQGWVSVFLRQQKDIQSISKEARRSPLLHIQKPLYFLFVFGGWSAVFGKIYPLIKASDVLSGTHIYAGYVVAVACACSWKMASSTSPGEITSSTLQRYDKYPYDNLMYIEGTLCPTLHLPKLARSKYDRYTNKLIPRFDHFCGWLRQPIGEENYREFLLFVAVHALMCTYGSIVVGTLFIELSKDHQGLIQYLFSDFPLTIIFVFLAVTCIPLLGFFGFHMHLVAKGMTTNEFYKWKLVHSRHTKAERLFQEQKRTPPYQNSESSVDHIEAAIDLSNDDPGPCPRNFYDNGIAKNVYDILSPRSLRWLAVNDQLSSSSSKHD